MLCYEPQAHSAGEENLPLLSPGLPLGALVMLSMAACLCYGTMLLEDTVCVFFIAASVAPTQSLVPSTYSPIV